MTPISVDYFLRYPQIDYLWDQSTIVSETAVSYNCGPVKVEIFMDDGLESAYDNIIFEDIQGSSSRFSIKYNQATNIIGSYNLSYKVYLERYPTVLVRSTAALTVHIKDKCVSPYLTLSSPTVPL